MQKTIKRLLSAVLVLIMVVTMLPASVFAAEDGLTIRASEASAVAGSTVTVTLDLENNPGLAALKVKVAFDDVLTLTNVAFNNEMGGNFQPPQKMTSPVSLTWYNGTANFTDENATFVTLTFVVSESAVADTVSELVITHNPSDVFDITETDIPLTTVNGSITVLDVVPGDINGDRVTNLKDQTRLFQYLADWDVEVNEPALDTNGDGSVNLKDQTRLFQYLADWDVEIYPIRVCSHVNTMTEVAYKAPTCTEDGNIAYWSCSKCKKNYASETGGVPIDASAIVVPATGHIEFPYSQEGCLDGIKCQTCGIIIKAAEPIGENVRKINYEIANGISYIESQIAKGLVTNPNPEYIAVTANYSLKNPTVPGYTFLGWYDLPAGAAAENVKKLTPDDGIDTLYAHWQVVEYTVQYKSNLSPIPSEKYTVETGLVLDPPDKVSNYAFAGWCDDNGNMYGEDAIPVGTTGHIVLTANWISERNKTVTKTTLDEPLIYEDDENGFIYFAYEIGKIENVPLQVVEDFGYLTPSAPTKTWTESYTEKTEEAKVTSYAEVVSEATTQSTNWTLSNGWSNTISVDKEWLEQSNMTEKESIERGTTETGEWYISNSANGSVSSTSLNSAETNWSNEVKIENSRQTDDTTKHAVGVDANVKFPVKVVDVGISASYDYENTSNTKTNSGFYACGSNNGTTLNTNSSEINSSWNTSSSYGSSQSSSETTSVAKELSKLVAENHHYGESYILSGDESNTQGIQSSAGKDTEYGTSVTYSKITEKKEEITWNTSVNEPGYYRWIVAGTAHVYGVVGYDIANDAYFVNTLSVMDDKTYNFSDYSYASQSYSDNQNGVISFEIPIDVADYVADKICASGGLNVSQATGQITAYTGTDNCVVLPEYMSVGDGDVIKVTGIGSKMNDNGEKKGAFAGNKNISAVVLSDFITEIPEGAFKNCTALEGIIGGNITTIGENAFSGCTTIAEAVVSAKITSLGDYAFTGVNKLIAIPSSVDVLKAVVNSGAKKIVIDLSQFAENDAALNGLTLTVPAGTEYFEINGSGKPFEGLSIISDAATTVVKKITLTGNGNVPLTASSSEVVLNQAALQAPGIAMALSAERTRVGLQSTVNVTTAKCRGLELYEVHATVDGLLAISDTLYTTNIAITGTEYLNCNNIVVINDEDFANTHHTAAVTFDANGGVVDGQAAITKTQTIGKAYGTLPVPARDYYGFDGWFTAAEGGEQITENTMFASAMPVTLYAHWTQHVDVGWVKASEAPADALILETKYSYDLTSYTTSETTNWIDGWTHYNTTSRWSDWGAWTDWSTNQYYASDSREVQQETWSNWVDTSYDKTQYHYYHACCGCHETWLYTYSGGHNGHSVLHDTWYDYELPYARTSGGMTWYGGTTCDRGNSHYWFKADGSSNGNYKPFTRVVHVSDGYTNYYNVRRCRDRNLIYTYYFSKVDSLESTTYPTGDNISNIVEWVQYRAK